jgi:acyl-CoA synthetase (NDP forming)/GNAT superfamily N-acetyltransferase
MTDGTDGALRGNGLRREVYALLADGVTVLIRPARPGDCDIVRQMHEAMSQDNSYLRFFGLSRAAAGQEARRVCAPPAGDRLALLAWLGTELVGVASYEPAGRPQTAEIAFAVADHAHRRGVAMLLLEHLVSAARSRGVRTFTAQTLAENYAMLKVFADTGLRVRRRLADGVTELTFDLPHDDADTGWDRYLDAVAARETHADAESLRHLLAPESVVVIGANRRAGSPGRVILCNIISAGYQGRLYAVSAPADQTGAVTYLPSVAALSEPVDLAVVVVPAAKVTGVAGQCGRRGVRTLVVITPGLGAAAGTSLLATCRRYGIRLAGPGSSGVAVPSIGLDATRAASHPAPGRAGLAVQSGDQGLALLEQLSRLGIGISSFTSLGDKCDVSGNDLLMWWEQDTVTELALLHLESFGNPRKFARTARRLSATMPVLATIPADPADGPFARHPAAGQGTSPATSRALFAQAGIIAARDTGELLECTALLASQPVPAGSRVAVVTGDARTSIAATDACTRHSLRVTAFTATSSGAFSECLARVTADTAVDAVLAVSGPETLTGLIAGLDAADAGKPLVLAVPGQHEAVRLIATPGGSRTLPAYASLENTARALAHAVRYGAWRARPPGHVPEFHDLHPDDARTVVEAFLDRTQGGGWLSPAITAELLGRYGIPLVPAWQASGKKGTEVTIKVIQEPVFGPLTVFGLASTASGVPSDIAARLAPLTDSDADSLIRSIRGASILLGHCDAPAADLAALTGMLLRVSRLAEDLPEVAELEISPVIARPDGVFAVTSRIRVTPATTGDPFLRQLR